MAGKEHPPVPPQQVGGGLNAPPLIVQDADPLRFQVGGSDPKTREFAAASASQAPEFREIFYPERPITGNPPDSDGSDGDDDVDDDEDDDVDDNDDGHEVKPDNTDYNCNSNDNETNKDSGSDGVAAGAVTVAEPESAVFYSQYLQATEASVSALKDMAGAENGCGFSGRKYPSSSSSSSNPRESLRAILSDPITGALMEDAMILPCGHSFGAGGIEQVKQMKACYTCSQPVSDDLITPNLSLQVAVEAFRREENLRMNRSSKRRREGSDQRGFSDSTLVEYPRSRSFQFPFSVADRVIIKGNKRTPPRFVGRVAVVTTQCLNGWYVVKTLDNAESVKLQYRSLAKAPEDPLSKATPPSKMVSNWL